MNLERAVFINDLMGALTDSGFRWLRTGSEAFSAMLAAIDNATQSVRLETYIYQDSGIGERFRQALINSAKRGVRVNVLIDGFGSYELSDSFWDGLKKVGGKVRKFNPLSLSRFVFRDHRKILVCDEKVAFLGGFNIAPEYDGDGVQRGWCDHGIEVKGELAMELARGFDDMFYRADIEHPSFARFRVTKSRRSVTIMHSTLILTGPGRGGNMLKKWLLYDLRKANNVWIETAYFLPTWRIRRELGKIISRGGSVRLILAGKSDVQLAKLAAQSLYWRLMQRGVEIYEYQPQILHAKLMVVDNVVYIGSANLDTRSLHIDYEVMLRIQDKYVASEARDILKQDLKHSLRVDPQTWLRTRGFMQKLKEKLAYFILARFDPLLARYQIRKLMKANNLKPTKNAPDEITPI
ncbi:MAG: phospholipase D-like domain-containing protein [Verrucomicrobiia bacterium]